MRASTILIGMLLLLGCASPARAGTIQGRLWVSKQVARTAGEIEGRGRARAARRSPAHVRRATVARLERGVSEAVVYVEFLPRDADQRLAFRPWWVRPPAPPRIVHAGQQFEPAVTVTPLRRAVLMENRDRVYHHPFAVTPGGELDLGVHAPGGADTLTFDRPGVMRLFCRLHSDELGFVVVVPNHAYARPDSLGRFTLRGLPEGSYRLRAWHPRLGSQVRDVTLGRGDARIEMAFAAAGS